MYPGLLLDSATKIFVLVRMAWFTAAFSHDSQLCAPGRETGSAGGPGCLETTKGQTFQVCELSNHYNLCYTSLYIYGVYS